MHLIFENKTGLKKIKSSLLGVSGFAASAVATVSLEPQGSGSTHPHTVCSSLRLGIVWLLI